MKSTLQPGLSHTHRCLLTPSHTVPALLPESAAFQAMPSVLATGYMVGLFEWACIELLVTWERFERRLAEKAGARPAP